MELRERIIKEATQMFVSNGIKSVRMDDIAENCGISKRTLYETFNGREELIKECIDYYMAEVNHKVDESSAGAQNIIEQFSLVFENCEVYRSVSSRFIKELGKFYPKIMIVFMKEHHDKVVEMIYRKLVTGVQDGLILEQIDLKYFAKAITNYIYGLTMLENQDDGFDSKDETRLRLALMIFFRGITTEKGRKFIDDKILNKYINY